MRDRGIYAIDQNRHEFVATVSKSPSSISVKSCEEHIPLRPDHQCLRAQLPPLDAVM